MLRPMVFAIALGLSLALGVPDSAVAQQPARYVAGAGLNVTADPGLDGQHVFGALLLPTPVALLRSRIEGLLQTTDSHGTSLAATANLRFAFLRSHSVRPYLLGGGGLHLGGSVGFAANAGLGAEFEARGRGLFVELVLRSFGTGDWQDGSFALSLGTAF